jgi:GNAT superfamily N-acetyltransferase
MDVDHVGAERPDLRCGIPMDVRTLSLSDVGLVASIDRSEFVEREYAVVDGELVERPVTMADVPTWDASGSGPHSVAAEVAFCRERLLKGGVLLGAFEGDDVLGLAIVEPRFDPPLARLAFLYVSRPHRRRGVATELWDAVVTEATAGSATELYVSAVPTESAVGFYRHRGCTLAPRPHPVLYAEEPDDVHLVCIL